MLTSATSAHAYADYPEAETITQANQFAASALSSRSQASYAQHFSALIGTPRQGRHASVGPPRGDGQSAQQLSRRSGRNVREAPGQWSSSAERGMPPPLPAMGALPLLEALCCMHNS